MFTFHNEDEVRFDYAKTLKARCLERENIDILTDTLLVECKFGNDLHKTDFHETLAQALFYQRILKKQGEARPYLVLCNEKSVIVLPSNQFDELLVDKNFPVKSGSEKNILLINTLKEFPILKYPFDRTDGIRFLKELEKEKVILKRTVTEYNVAISYDEWKSVVMEYLQINDKTIHEAFIFYEDITEQIEKKEDKPIYAVSESEFNGRWLTIEFHNQKAVRIKQIPEVEYLVWESRWHRIDKNSEQAQVIHDKIYELLEMDARRMKGQFYTPHKLARLAWQTICEQLGENFWQDGTWRIWDNSAGSGNLEYEVIPREALQYLYLSTINPDEIADLRANNYFKGKCRGIFQFDWLNDHNSNLPKVLQDDLENKEINWLFFINPPYAESGTGIGKEYKIGVKRSNIADEMKKEQLGKCANEKKMQFLYRIERDFGKRGYYLGLFSTPKWITKPSSDELRQRWKPIFDGGFMLKASEHFVQQRNEKHELKAHGTFPIIFSVLDRRKKAKTWQQDWTYNIVDVQTHHIGTKSFHLFEKERLAFRDYFFTVVKGEKKKPMPIMSGAVIPSSGKSRQDGKVITDFVGSFCPYHTDFQGQQMCYLQSALPTSHEVCITPSNYRSVLTGFALYKAVKYDWKNHEDIYYAPYRDLTKTEKTDCLLYALLESKNNTATTKVHEHFLENWFNPFDEKKFDFSQCSKMGKKAFAELTNYCYEKVHWNKLVTPYGDGIWLGLYQYRTSYDNVNKTYQRKFGTDYPNKDLYGIPYPESFEQAIEALRQRVEALAVELCLSPVTEMTRTQETFLGEGAKLF